MPFVLIVQFLFSGMLFTLQGPAALVGSLTISKWGMNAACVSADYNNLENTELVNTSVALQNIASREGYSLDGGQVDAITASTITSRAFLNAVNAAYFLFFS